MKISGIRRPGEAVLQESEEHFRLLTRAAFEGICISENGRICDINDQILKMFGYERNELIGKAIDDLVAPESRAIVAEAIRTGREDAYEHQLLRKDGSVFYAEAQAKMFQQGSHVLRMTALRDITGRKEAEAALKHSEERFSRIFHSNPLPIALTRLSDGLFLDVNESFFLMSGFTREEVIGHSALELNFYPDPGRRAFIIEQLHRHGHLYGHEQLFRAKSGQIRNHLLWFDIVSINGEQCILVVALDVTERKRAEASLNLFRALIDQSSDGVEVVDPETGRFLDVNETTCKRLGYTRDELLSMSVPDIEVDAVNLSSWRKTIEELCQSNFKTFEGRQRRKDGSVFPVEVSARYVKLDRDYIIAAVRDITERKQMETSHARLAMAVEQADETIVITDTRGIILYANPAFEKTTGYTLAEALGQNPRILKSGKQDPEYYRQMWEIIGRGEVWNGHFINQRKDGTFYEEEATISPVRDATGKVANYVAVKRDVTREVQLENQFRQSQKMEAIGTLASGVAHDFNNILAVINLQAGLMKTDPGIPPQLLDSAGEIEKAAERASNLTRQLLMFGRRSVMQRRDLDLNQSINDMAKMLRRILGEDIQIQFRFSPQLLFIHADAGMLDQVLLNLAVNARDAMPKGGQLVIETSAVDFDESILKQSAQARPGAFVCFSMSDTGYGIPPENLPRIFEPFFTTKDAGKGSGLGLATVFGIVEQHQGWISINSEVGRGTTFRIYLPRLAGMSDLKSKQSGLTSMRGGNETILLVEDDTAVCAVLRKTLSQLGYRVLDAINGIEALEVWKQNRDEIHLLLTDLVMPGGMTGKELGERLLKENPKLKVIYTSGYGLEVVGRDFPLQEGVNFLSKPFETHKFAETVRNCLDKPAKITGNPPAANLVAHCVANSPAIPFHNHPAMAR